MLGTWWFSHYVDHQTQYPSGSTALSALRGAKQQSAQSIQGNSKAHKTKSILVLLLSTNTWQVCCWPCECDRQNIHPWQNSYKPIIHPDQRLNCLIYQFWNHLLRAHKSLPGYPFMWHYMLSGITAFMTSIHNVVEKKKLLTMLQK